VEVETQDLQSQMTAVNQSQVKMRALCDTLRKQKKDAEAKYQALETQVKAGGEVRIVMEYAAPVVDVDAAVESAVTAALVSAKAEYRAKLTMKEAVIQQLREDLTAATESTAKLTADYKAAVEGIRARNEKLLAHASAEKTKLEADCLCYQRERDQLQQECDKQQASIIQSDLTTHVLEEALAAQKKATAKAETELVRVAGMFQTMHAQSEEAQKTVESSKNVQAERDAARQRVGELEQLLAAAPSAETFAAQSREVQELAERQSKRAGLVSAAVDKLRRMFPSNLEWLAKRAVTHTPDMPQDKLDYFLLGSFGREPLDKLVLGLELAHIAQTPALSATGAGAGNVALAPAGTISLNSVDGGAQEDGEVQDEMTPTVNRRGDNVRAASAMFPSDGAFHHAATQPMQSCESSISTASAAPLPSSDWSRPQDPMHPPQWPHDTHQQSLWRPTVPAYPQDITYIHAQQDNGTAHNGVYWIQPTEPLFKPDPPHNYAPQEAINYSLPQPEQGFDPRYEMRWSQHLQEYRLELKLPESWQPMQPTQAFQMQQAPPQEPRISRFGEPQPQQQQQLPLYAWAQQPQQTAHSEPALTSVLRKLPSSSSLDAQSREERASGRPLNRPFEFTEVRITEVLPRTQEKRVRDLAERYGEVVRFDAMPAKTAYYVKYRLPAAAAQAVESLNLYELDNKNITCQRYYRPVKESASTVYAKHPSMSAGEIELELRRYGDVDSMIPQDGGFLAVFFHRDSAERAAQELHCQYICKGKFICELLGGETRQEDRTDASASRRESFPSAKPVLADPLTQKRSRAASPPRRLSNGRDRSEERDNDSRERGGRRGGREDSRERGRPPPISPARGVVLNDPAISRRGHRERSRSRSPTNSASDRAPQTTSFRGTGSQKAVLVDPALPATSRAKKNGKFCSICQRLGRTFDARTHNDDEHADKIPSRKSLNNSRGEDRVPVKTVTSGSSAGSVGNSAESVDVVLDVTKPLSARR
jgi:hypothetical protein